MLAAVIFDFDGIIVDTEPLHYKAFQEVLIPLGMGYGWDEYLGHYIGFDDRDAFREAFRRNGRELTADELHRLIGEKAEAFQKIIATGVEPYPGVVELICSLSGKFPVGLCSGALRSDIDPILAQLRLGNAFDCMVTADEVSASKPDPESYALAVRRLSEVFPERSIIPAVCLAIEDTPAGIASATGAGLKVLAVSNSYPAERLVGVLKVVESLAGVDDKSLSSLF